MNYNYKNKNNSTTGIRLMCAIVFVIFSLAWLFFFQADILAMTQHVLSGGLTHYNRTLGALIITFVLLLVQTGVYKLTNLRRQAYALTYVPSMLMLALISDVEPMGGGTISFASSWWVALLLLLL